MSEVLPVFFEARFAFKKDKVPEHIEGEPGAPSHLGVFTVYGLVDGTRPYPLATDVPSEKLAYKIARARQRFQERTIANYGYTDDVCIGYPDSTSQRVYFGHSEHSDRQ